MNKRSTTLRLVTMAFLIATEIVLTRFCSINTPILRIGFGFLPIAMMGIKYGPLWAGFGYAIGDILGMLIFPSGAYFPGFTLTAFITGYVFGLFLYNKEYSKSISWKRVLPATLIVVLGCNLILDTFWLTILMGDGFIALLPTRILKCVVMIPIQLILIPLIWNRVMSHVPSMQGTSA